MPLFIHSTFLWVYATALNHENICVSPTLALLPHATWCQRWDGKHWTGSTHPIQFLQARQVTYRITAGLTTKDETRQIDTLLYCMGKEAYSVLTLTNISADDRKKYTTVVAKFDEYFKVRRNTIYERESPLPKRGRISRTIHCQSVRTSGILWIQNP